MLDRLYARTLALAASRHAMVALVLVAFAESSFFPLPPDLLLIPMVIARPRRAFAIAAAATLASVAGGFLGYAIGYFLFDAIGRPVLQFYDAMDKYEALKSAFHEWGVWIILIKGLTPIPYKLITIASGVAQFPLVPFGLASLASRSIRFFLLAALLWRFGEPVCVFIERRLMLVTSLFAAALVGGFVALRYL
ncbi:MAG TPA: VTT domain-containing protein [Stellaceae bacterium]|nr:VTT domain-containing protein [Stellaceae bacterium]